MSDIAPFPTATTRAPSLSGTVVDVPLRVLTESTLPLTCSSVPRTRAGASSHFAAGALSTHTANPAPTAHKLALRHISFLPGLEALQRNLWNTATAAHVQCVVRHLASHPVDRKRQSRRQKWHSSAGGWFRSRMSPMALNATGAAIVPGLTFAQRCGGEPPATFRLHCIDNRTTPVDAVLH